MQSREKHRNQRLAGILRTIDAHLPLPLLGFIGGILGGAAYALDSASHMVLSAQVDLYIVGLMLALLGGAIGWLAGALLRLPLATRGNQAAVQQPPIHEVAIKETPEGS
jgi:hypothetical protein